MRPTPDISAPFEPDELPDEGAAGRSLANLAERATRWTPGCCAAVVTATDSTGAALTAAPDGPVAVTHPDLTALTAIQWSSGDGPVPEAVATGSMAGADDLLREKRWPEYRAQALDLGLRATATVPYRRDGLVLTITVCSFRPSPLSAAVRRSTADLGELVTAVLVRDRRYRDALAEVEQLHTALRSRPVVDQACGIVMAVTECDADEAFTLLRKVSQRTNRKLYDLAEGLVAGRGRRAEIEQLLHRLDTRP